MPESAGLVATLATPRGLALVGASAQLYRPTGPGRWRREHAGGVSIDVRGAFAGPDGAVYAVGTSSPLFALADGSWAAHPLPNRGATAVNSGAIAAIAVGRHVYGLGPAGWKRLASARTSITALWAASEQRTYAATEAGELAVLTGSSWTNLRSPLEKGDAVELMAAAPGRPVIAVSRAGAVLELGAFAARILPLASELEGLSIKALGSAGKSSPTLYAVGSLEGDGQRRWVLARIDKDSVVLDEPLWPLVPGDEITIVTGLADGSVLVASRRGQVRIRDPKGLWRNGQVSLALPRPPAEADGRAAPARSR